LFASDAGEDDEDARRGAGLAGIDGSPYFLYVGTSEPKKNVIEVFRALQRFREATPMSRDQRLVLVGPNDKARRRLLGVADRMGMRGLVASVDGLSDLELRDVYRSADALLHLSWSEGLAWPVLEAQACGTPVVCSDRGALPETAGGAARVVPAGTDGSAACEALLQLHGDEEGRADLVRLGRERVHGLTREAAAAAVMQVWREARGE
jgi:alpha-1,3-rhamnosyl/mannosyltransferase